MHAVSYLGNMMIKGAYQFLTTRGISPFSRMINTVFPLIWAILKEIINSDLISLLNFYIFIQSA